MLDALIRFALQHEALDAREVNGMLRIALAATYNNYPCSIIVTMEPRFDTLALTLGY